MAESSQHTADRQIDEIEVSIWHAADQDGEECADHDILEDTEVADEADVFEKTSDCLKDDDSQVTIDEEEFENVHEIR